MYSKPRFLLAGDSGIIVEFGDEISEEVNRKVLLLASALEGNPLSGVGETVPTYRSLLVHYDPERLSCAEVKAFVTEVLLRCQEGGSSVSALFEIPVVYGGQFGPDIEFVASHNSISVKDVVSIHSGTSYPVYMLGFSPGFAYLGEVAETIATPRLETPRVVVPAGSVGIAGRQTGIYPMASPGGWRLIGRTPLSLFRPQRDPPTALGAGDTVRFVPISEEEYWARLTREEHGRP